MSEHYLTTTYWSDRVVHPLCQVETVQKVNQELVVFNVARTHLQHQHSFINHLTTRSVLLVFIELGGVCLQQMEFSIHV